MAADVAQRGSSRIKSYASAFSNILIKWLLNVNLEKFVIWLNLSQ